MAGVSPIDVEVDVDVDVDVEWVAVGGLSLQPIAKNKQLNILKWQNAFIVTCFLKVSANALTNNKLPNLPERVSVRFKENRGLRLILIAIVYCRATPNE